MYFKRKAYNKLLEWKKNYSDKYAVLLEGASELENQRLQRTLPETNTSHILYWIFQKYLTISLNALMILEILICSF